MAKGKKEKIAKPRPDKYTEKVAINIGFDEVLQLFSDSAHDSNVKIEEPGIEPSEEV